MKTKLKVKFKKLHDKAVIPTIANPGDAGSDLTATSIEHELNSIIRYGTGIAIEIPIGYVGLIYPRSSIYKKQLVLSNCVGVIDSGYRGELMLRFWGDREAEIYKVGDRIGQLVIMPIPSVEFEEVEELEDTERGEGGFGSTGE